MMKMDKSTTPPLESLLVAWDNMYISHTGISYQATQRRMLVFLPLHHLERFRIFIATADEKKWSWSTRECYWTAMIAAASLLQVPVTTVERKHLKFLKAQRILHGPNSPPPLMANLVAIIARQPLDLVSLAIVSGFCLGQRISDISKWHADKVTTGSCGVCITMVEGKVIPQVGPYTIFVGSNNVGLSIRRLAENTKMLKQTYMFPTNLSHLVCMRLKAFDESLESRSVRRGGLQHMAENGVPLQDILLLSRHRSVEMLYNYLRAGACAVAEARLQLAATSHAFRDIFGT